MDLEHPRRTICRESCAEALRVTSERSIAPAGRGSVHEVAWLSQREEEERADPTARKASARHWYRRTANKASGEPECELQETAPAEIRRANPTGCDPSRAGLPSHPAIPLIPTPSRSSRAGSHAGASGRCRLVDPVRLCRPLWNGNVANETRENVNDRGHVDEPWHRVHDLRLPHRVDATIPVSPARHREPHSATQKSTSVLAGCGKAR